MLGRHRKKIQPWVTDEVLELCDKRRELRCKKYSCPKGKLEYQQTNKAVRRKMKGAKENWRADQCASIDKNMQAGNSKQAYSTLKVFTRPQQSKTSIIEDKDGNILTDSDQVLKR